MPKPIFEIEPKSSHKISEIPLLNRIYQNRGISSIDELNYSMSAMIPPNLMKGMDEACAVIEKHILLGNKILIVGDYDCDGATATSIAVEGLKLLGGENVEFLVPDRMKHGYGLSPAVVALAGESKPDLIITVDNGIASFEGAQAVADLEHPCELVITDHHLAPENGVPKAQAIVNPNQDGCEFPSKAIAGCGVMFYVIVGLRAHMRMNQSFDKLNMAEPKLDQLLDLVALGTVADVVPLDKNNRILVATGLARINRGLCRPGIHALLTIGKKELGSVVSQDMGFTVGPRLNAAGRLDDMTLGIKCLLSWDNGEARRIASQLDDFNVKRKMIESDMVEEAVAQWDSFETESRGVCLHSSDWHEGVVGIVASRIKERLNRPVICFSDTEEAKEVRAKIEFKEASGAPESDIKELYEELGQCDAKGSARSVPGVHLKHVLDEINKSNPEILTKFGGHAMAAGMSIKIAHYQRFSELFNDIVSRELTPEDIAGKIEVDIKDMPGSWMTMDNAHLLKFSDPWGQNFLPPVFSSTFNVVDYKILKEKHVKMRLKLPNYDAEFDAIAFNCIEDGSFPCTNIIDVSFTLDINEYRGNRTLQLMVREMQNAVPNYQVEKKAESEYGSVAIQGLAKRQKAPNPSLSVGG